MRKTKKIIITLCPKCKEYLADTSKSRQKYKYCMYCGWKYNAKKLIREKIEVSNCIIGEPDINIEKEKIK